MDFKFGMQRGSVPPHNHTQVKWSWLCVGTTKNLGFLNYFWKIKPPTSNEIEDNIHINVKN